MIVVDASALVAIAEREPEAPSFLAALQKAEAALISPVNYVETGLILMSRAQMPSQQALDEWLVAQGIKLARGYDLGEAALAAYLRYGKGLHPARLNLGDCFAYALAKALDAPLLFKGDDFPLTDIRSAL